MNQTTRDPRVCKIPMTEFNHLSLEEVAVSERLGELSNLGTLSSARYQILLLRRVDPDRGDNNGNAA